MWDEALGKIDFPFLLINLYMYIQDITVVPRGLSLELEDVTQEVLVEIQRRLKWVAGLGW